ncbi:hemerythrin domain-containing protein [Catenuloplanes japonicus]|uniref:hemerythrin domain-containing protein n=1 Tax=Catenuloplanes japonicus TaxID=33876 RepID=UPI000A1044B7|nr:hemerythrin domain-containing protein [Catenuloplanes japonicus]
MSPFAVVATTDDGSRRSDRRVLDEATRPTGPARDPQRTYTRRELMSGRHLVDIHDHLRADLARIHRLAERVADGSTEAGAARAEINAMALRRTDPALTTYCANYCRMVTMHHGIEDASMFPHLRRADPRLAPVITRLEQEHHAIHGVLEEVDRALVGYVGDPSTVDRLRAAVDLLSDTLLSHLAYEEHELVEPIARLGMH